MDGETDPCELALLKYEFKIKYMNNRFLEFNWILSPDYQAMVFEIDSS